MNNLQAQNKLSISYIIYVGTCNQGQRYSVQPTPFKTDTVGTGPDGPFTKGAG